MGSPKNFYPENGHPTKSGPQIQCDINESLYAILHKNRKKKLEIHRKAQKTPLGQSNPK